ncbi:hypothetical protein D3C81_835150 [compost metagenome]
MRAQLRFHLLAVVHRQVGQNLVIERDVVVEKADRAVRVAVAHGDGKLEPGFAGAEDANAPDRPGLGRVARRRRTA